MTRKQSDLKSVWMFHHILTLIWESSSDSVINVVEQWIIL